MFTYILKRLLAMIPTLIGITFVTFLIIRLAPGDPVAAQFGKGGGERTASDSGSSEGGSRDEAIRAKKKLLGMLEENRAVIVFDGTRAAAARDFKSTDEYRSTDELEPVDSLGTLHDWITALCRSDDGHTLFVASGKPGQVFSIDADTGDLSEAPLQVHETEISALATTPDGARLISADTEGGVKSTALAGAVFVDAVSVQYTVRDIAVHPSGKWFVTAAGDGRVRMHDTATAKVLQTVAAHIGFASSVAFSKSGATLFTAGYDRRVQRYDVDENGKIADKSTVVGTTGQGVLDIDVSPDGKSIAAGSEDNAVWVFPVDGGGEPITLTGHFKPVTAVTFLPDGRTLVSASNDESIRAWDIPTGRLTAQTSKNQGQIHRLAVSPDGSHVYAVGETWRQTSMLTQYATWAGRLAVLDFGNSFRFPDRKVMDMVFEAAPVTIGLNLIAVLIIYSIAIPLGVVAAVRRGSTFDNTTSFVLFLLWSMPSFWVATLLIISLSSKRHLDIFDSVGLHAQNAGDMAYLPWLGDFLNHLVLPVIAMVYSGFTVLSRFARTSLLETISQDFVRTARAKGLSERVVVFKHAFRNSLISIVTLLGSLLPGMIGGSIIIEVIFTIDGMGRLGFEAILARDYPVIMAVTTIGAVLTLIGVLISDVLYSIVDPRISVG